MIAERRLLWSVMTGVLLIAPNTAADVQQIHGPVIINPSKSEIILQTGQNFTLICTSNRQVQFKQQEIPEEITGNFYTEERNETSEDGSEYRAFLDLYNVDQFAVGYYACFDDTVDSAELLRDVVEEPNNTAHVSYIYVYVNGSTLFAPMRSLVVATGDSKFLVECKPTSPEIKVQLTLDFADIEYDRYNPKLGFTIDSDVLSDSLTSIFTCGFVKQGNIEYKDVIVHKHIRANAPKPTIFGGLQYFLDGETFMINCTVPVQRNIPVHLSWVIPGDWSKVSNKSNAYNWTEDNPILYNNITIKNAGREDAGNYICVSKTSNTNSSNFSKLYLEEPMLNVIKRNKDVMEVKNMRSIRLKIDIDSYPPANVTVYRDDAILPDIPDKYELDYDRVHNSFTLKIKKLVAEDTGIYTFHVTNQHKSKSVAYDLRYPESPKVDFGPEIDKKYMIKTQASLVCEAVGYPLPEITWVFSDGTDSTTINKKYQHDVINKAYKVTSTLTLEVRLSGYITCNAENVKGNDTATRRFLVYEMPNGFGIKNENKLWYSEGDNVTLECLASKYEFANVTWYDDKGFELTNVLWSENEFSKIASLILDNISVLQARRYTCEGAKEDGTLESYSVNVTVAEIKPPVIVDTGERTQDVVPFQPVNMTCEADAVPPPKIEWYKDQVPQEDNENVQIDTFNLNQTTLKSTIRIPSMQEEFAGTYECKVISQNHIRSKYHSLVLKEKMTHRNTYLSVAGVIFFILILLVVYLIWKIRKEKQFRKELAAAGLLYFKEGVTKSINPDLGIDEQAELLPYDEKFEFPPERLTFGKQLGAGAFGVVYKAEARGIINAEESTTVAVKMVKKTADNMYIKALASELKIMVHLGKHINIVNLLGACTKNVGKRELIVIVEYCKFGNIHNYLQKHREVFIDQLNDNSEKTLGKVNRGYSSSSGNSGLHSDYFGSNHTQDTDHTFLNTANTNRSARKVSESGYIQPEWRSNYESDYSFDGRSPRPLCSRDLLAWAFQIARGMEYLASRKVLHGDLAARNILLAEDNIVKICDFGLARSIYKNDEYQKKENSPLPVKWLAIECMTDRIFSTQSDVWSFGIVLWELFSLAKTPYPNISPPSLLQWLSEGHRLEKPAYADERLYDVMKRCWSQKPTARPTFTQLQELLGSFLEDNVRNHYVDLNAMYADMNAKHAGEEDYLDMVSAPDYNNLVTPSPHHYVNDARSFFPPTPTQLPHDDEGYLQMSPASRQTVFNPRAQGTKFDFDARKLTPRVSEANSYGSESTPMLTLNNLPRSGSESDQEGNSSPYLNMCPRIDEETDDVFGTKENNAKNVQPSAVTNPTYITLSVDNDKKPQNFANTYINVNVPNGLVK
ncbi:vascular endothelial growth factor receptor kdr-like isoform X3 [Pectinophora gossypiella]|uniref:vascular endothelial growth factor receptor kdr-like isoform X3 n=1 Tax=Pectinophora gossypiella TaxID=13191 RepID=UPI00214E1545|nr:vascular endothelial growth factor receptor kdr-like isoform X3 [Pectinophora gossypiella]